MFFSCYAAPGVKPSTLTWQGVGARLSFVRQSNIVHDLIHLSLHLLLRKPLKTGVKPDVLLDSQPRSNQVGYHTLFEETWTYTETSVCVLVTVLHAEEDVVLRTDPQVLSDGAELGANVFAEDVRCTRGGREQSRQDWPTGRNEMILSFWNDEPLISTESMSS